MIRVTQRLAGVDNKKSPTIRSFIVKNPDKINFWKTLASISNRFLRITTETKDI